MTASPGSSANLRHDSPSHRSRPPSSSPPPRRRLCPPGPRARPQPPLRLPVSLGSRSRPGHGRVTSIEYASRPSGMPRTNRHGQISMDTWTCPPAPPKGRACLRPCHVHRVRRGQSASTHGRKASLGPLVRPLVRSLVHQVPCPGRVTSRSRRWRPRADVPRRSRADAGIRARPGPAWAWPSVAAPARACEKLFRPASAGIRARPGRGRVLPRRLERRPGRVALEAPTNPEPDCDVARQCRSLDALLTHSSSSSAEQPQRRTLLQ